MKVEHRGSNYIDLPVKESVEVNSVEELLQENWVKYYTNKESSIGLYYSDKLPNYSETEDIEKYPLINLKTNKNGELETLWIGRIFGDPREIGLEYCQIICENL